MNKEVKTLLITLGVALGLIWIFKPKKDNAEKSVNNKYAEPKEATEDVKKEENKKKVYLYIGLGIGLTAYALIIFKLKKT